ncbi:MAG: Tim44/TimA family putative adaptor protein [Alphaproteobacteria bacterium]
MDFGTIFFAMVALVCVWYLRRNLGRRTGHERPPRDPFGRSPGPQGDRVVALPDRSRRDKTMDARTAEGKSPLEAGLTQIQIADPSFDPDSFTAGARAAFEMIVTSYAAGDKDTLRPLLSDDVYENFEKVIAERAEKRHTLETTLVSVRSSDIIEASMDGRVAFLTVKFVTEQINVTRDENGSVTGGDPGHVATVTDIWAFARNTRSRNPNWTLVATDSPN